MTPTKADLLRYIGGCWLILFSLAGCRGCEKPIKSAVEAPLEAIIWGLDSTSGPEQTEAAETEPNDTIAHASSVQLEAGDDLDITGSLSSNQDVDWYALNTSDWSGDLKVQPRSSDCDIAASLTTGTSMEQRAELQSVAAGLTETLRRTSFEDSVLLKVYSVKGAGAYTLGLDPRDLGEGEREPNDWSATAQPLEFGESLEATIRSQADRDLFRVPASRFSVSVRSDKTIPLTLEVWERAPDESGNTDSKQEPRLQWTIPFQDNESVEIPAVAVEGSKKAWLRFSGKESRSYEVTVGKGADSATETEPNDNPETRHLLESPGSLSGRFFRPADTDHFGVAPDETDQTQDRSRDKLLDKIESLKSQNTPKKTYWRFQFEPSGKTPLAAKLQRIDESSEAKRLTTGSGETLRACLSHVRAVATSIGLHRDGSVDGKPDSWPLEYTVKLDSIETTRTIEGPLALPAKKRLPISKNAAQTIKFDISGESMRSVGLDVTAPAFDVGLQLTDSTGGLIAKVDDNGVGQAESFDVELPSGQYRLAISTAETRKAGRCRFVNIEAEFEEG